MRTPTLMRPIAGAVLAALSLAGCVSPELLRDTKQAADDAGAKTDAITAALYARMHRDRAAVEREQDVAKPFLAGRAVPIERNVTLPVALRKDVDTFVIFPERTMPLAVAAQRIFMATGIPVKVESDVYLPAAMLLPRSMARTATQGGAATMNGAGATTMPVSTGLGAAPTPQGPLPAGLAGPTSAATAQAVPLTDTAMNVEFKQSEKMPLASMLDLIATRLSLNWEYVPSKGVIRFYRLKTKMWSLPFRGKESFSSDFLPPALMNSSTASGGTGQQAAASSSKSDDSATVEMDGIRDSITPVMTMAGAVSLNANSGLLTLTDTREAVERADEIVRAQIAQASRRIYVKLQTIDFTMNDNSEAGVDWSAALSKALAHIPGFAFSALSPATLTDTLAGSFGLSLTSGDGTGTSAIVNALREFGTATTAVSIPFNLRNRHASEVDNRHTFNYVASTTPATSTAGGTGGVPGITTATDAVGLRVKVYADATSRDDVSLTLAFEQSVLDGPIEKFTSGSGSSQQSVQLPKKIVRSVPQHDFQIRNGQTLIVTAIDQSDTAMTRRTLADHLPLLAGGSQVASKSRTVTLVVATVMVQDQGTGGAE